MYRFKQSVAKYEIMALDVTRIIYDTKKKDKRVQADAESIDLNRKSVEKMRQKRDQENWQNMKLSDLNTNT